MTVLSNDSNRGHHARPHTEHELSAESLERHTERSIEEGKTGKFFNHDWYALMILLQQLDLFFSIHKYYVKKCKQIYVSFCYIKICDFLSNYVQAVFCCKSAHLPPSLSICSCVSQPVHLPIPSICLPGWCIYPTIATVINLSGLCTCLCLQLLQIHKYLCFSICFFTVFSGCEVMHCTSIMTQTTCTDAFSLFSVFGETVWFVLVAETLISENWQNFSS